MQKKNRIEYDNFEVRIVIPALEEAAARVETYHCSGDDVHDALNNLCLLLDHTDFFIVDVKAVVKPQHYRNYKG